ncbi:MAG: carbonate dehydratase [Deltaproteobacteria bacterium]|nr:carbonate dehydratase [Deltaproteobacteria bacterium]
MDDLQHLFDNNNRWAERHKQQDPDFFLGLSRQQAPRYLWVGCSDSRVPANEIVGLNPGEIFVHRNVANLVIHTDLNCLSVIQYAVDVLKVGHIIVCGHYGCGGVSSAMSNQELGLIDNWLMDIKDLYHRNRSLVDGQPTETQRLDLLCELNVKTQAANVGHTAIIQNAWRRGQKVTIHGWIYSIQDGLLRDLGVSVSGQGQTSPIYHL